MRWPSFLQRKDSGATATREDAVQSARIRARRRLIGAVVLLAVGVIGFPLLFETQPRPVPPDIAFDAVRRAPTPPAARAIEPPARPPPATTADEPREAPARPRAEPPVVEAPVAASEAAAPAVAVAPTVPAAPAPRAAPTASAAAVAERPVRPVRPAAPPAAERASAAAPAADAASVPEAARYVLQVGAYAEAATVREVRAKVERLGLKTYTQVVETPSGARTRVRIGPFDTRDAAAAAGVRLKAAGLPFNLLAL